MTTVSTTAQAALTATSSHAIRALTSDRHCRSDASAAAGRGIEADDTADGVEPVLHVGQPTTACCQSGLSRHEADAVIDDADARGAVACPKFRGDVVCLG